MTSALHGPGILWVQSRIKPACQDMIDETTFLRWYDEEHITEIVATSGIESAFRFVNIPSSSQDDEGATTTPFLALYPMDDLAFTTSDEFREIRVQSDILPGGGIVYDLADFDVSYFGLSGANKVQGGEDIVSHALTARFEIGAEGERNIETCNRQFAATTLALGYIRTLSFQLRHTHSSTLSSELNAGDEAHARLTSWLCVHEFSIKPGEIVISELAQAAKYHIGVAKMATSVWTLDRSFGHGKFFV
ncbi:hypothetical protein T440DRAFT_66790 [Plenodomus tracheiphilus IPT5]|uniref:EthD domain-containing protein n=1 Tax=Plenodomus tracheiphilus IPT5 TaxID=1408161 RepID=A0A6A7B9Z7_9PLEO|nr:hypothetical protein T440DRAFT_66790 [Plenodomus tracheiphilus IPT5]